jgi:hypothetical protein
MSDDNKNDAMMAKFIETATPKLLEALTGQVTELVEGKISGLVENSTRMLDQLKDAKREPDPKSEELMKMVEALQAERKTETDKAAGLDVLFAKPAALQLTREQARDPKTYRAAKAKAEAYGTTVQIIADE